MISLHQTPNIVEAYWLNEKKIWINWQPEENVNSLDGGFPCVFILFKKNILRKWSNWKDFLWKMDSREESQITHTHTYIYINTHRNCVILRRSHRIPAKRELKRKYIRETDKNPIEIYFVLKLHFRANFWYVCMFVLFQRSMLFVQTFTSHFWHVFFSTPLLFVFFLCVTEPLSHCVAAFKTTILRRKEIFAQ